MSKIDQKKLSKKNLSTVREELALLDTPQAHEQTFKLMYTAFLESDWANDRDKRVQVMVFYQTLKDSF